ncbi:HGxxPAAW family protein [Streptomyces sp. NPDC006798]|uniref:HGxxPAAW family protein n=1 Tax=Streptomyces sp. NPDC006798 TaxID=3155462 RepID=UPI0033D4563A
MSEYDHGHTVAGWTGFTVATTGSAVAAVGVVGWRPGIWLGIVIMAAAVLVTWWLHLAGRGKPPGSRPVGQRGFGGHDEAARLGHPECLSCRLAGRSGVPAADRGAPEPESAAEATTP